VRATPLPGESRRTSGTDTCAEPRYDRLGEEVRGTCGEHDESRRAPRRRDEHSRCADEGRPRHQVRVEPPAFADAASRLGALYAAAKTHVWDTGFAVFEAPPGGLIEPTLISLVAIGSPYDWNGAGVWDLLAHDATVLARYNELKARHAGRSRNEYEEAKTAFFRELLADRGPRPSR
jgi:hypothetical protein